MSRRRDRGGKEASHQHEKHRGETGKGGHKEVAVISVGQQHGVTLGSEVHASRRNPEIKTPKNQPASPRTTMQRSFCHKGTGSGITAP